MDLRNLGAPMNAQHKCDHFDWSGPPLLKISLYWLGLILCGFSTRENRGDFSQLRNRGFWGKFKEEYLTYILANLLDLLNIRQKKMTFYKHMAS